MQDLPWRNGFAICFICSNLLSTQLSLLIPTTGYNPSRGVGDQPHLRRCWYKSRNLPVLPAAIQAQSASPDAEVVLQGAGLSRQREYCWACDLARGLIRGLFIPVVSQEGLWKAGPVGESSSSGALPPEPGAELLHKRAMQGSSDLFWAGAFSSRVGWAWQTCSAC